jgi:3-oxoadipate enol-lactonase
MCTIDIAEARALADELVGKLFASRVLIRGLGRTARIRPVWNRTSSAGLEYHLSEAETAAINTLLGRITALIQMGSVDLIGPGRPAKLTVFEHVLSDFLALGTYQKVALCLSNGIDELLTDLTAGVMRRFYHSSSVYSKDGARLMVYSAGAPNREAVVLVLPCGMPMDLAEEWVRQLSQEFFVLTWESRGMSSTGEPFETYSYDVDAQVQDLLAIMDHWNVHSAHIMGLCGGAIIALRAARQASERITSLSLWHGDYELGPRSPKTTHQTDLRALLGMVASDRSAAASLHELLSDTGPPSVHKEFAHLVLYPYSNVELLFRYARLNGAIMSTNVAGIVKDIVQPTLVVTSLDDATAHPDGSRFVAAELKNSTLQVLPHGDHLTLFRADRSAVTLARDFILGTVQRECN